MAAGIEPELDFDAAFFAFGILVVHVASCFELVRCSRKFHLDSRFRRNSPKHNDVIVLELARPF